MKRAQVLAEINSILDGKCHGCNKKSKLFKQYGSKRAHYVTTDYYCLNDCPIGKRLQELGKQLGRGATEASTAQRKQRREWLLADDEDDQTA